jgi:hypothetical protein
MKCSHGRGWSLLKTRGHFRGRGCCTQILAMDVKGSIWPNPHSEPPFGVPPLVRGHKTAFGHRKMFLWITMDCSVGGFSIAW